LIRFFQVDNADAEQQEQLRRWIERYLMARTGSAGRLVRQWAVEGAGDLPEENRKRVERLVSEQHLLRREEGQVVRYELLHDRLLEPITRANRFAQVRQRLAVTPLSVWPAIACILVSLAFTFGLARTLWHAAPVIKQELQPAQVHPRRLE
jgi:hypothetical protein